MGTQNRKWLAVLAALLVVGFAAGAAWTIWSDDDATDFETLDPDPSFWFQYPAAVVEGSLDHTSDGVEDVEGVLVSLSELAVRYESATSRTDNPPELWPADGGVIEFDAIRGLDEPVAAPGDRVIVMLSNRAPGDDRWPWVANMFGVVQDDASIRMLNDTLGEQQAQLDHVAATLDFSQVEAFVQLAADIRYMREASQSTGEFPEDIGPAARAIEVWPPDEPKDYDYWYTADPRVRGYDEDVAPPTVREAAQAIQVHWTVAADVAEGDSDVLIHVRDGTAISGSFVATLEEVRDVVRASPGSDLEVVLATWDNFVGEVIGTIPASVWEDAELLEIVVTRQEGRVVARLTDTSG